MPASRSAWPGEPARGGGRHAACSRPPSPAASGKRRRSCTPRSPAHHFTLEAPAARAGAHTHARALAFKHTHTDRVGEGRAALLPPPLPAHWFTQNPAPLPKDVQLRGTATAARGCPQADARPPPTPIQRASRGGSGTGERGLHKRCSAPSNPSAQQVATSCHATSEHFFPGRGGDAHRCARTRAAMIG